MMWPVDDSLSPEQQAMVALWEKHVEYEFQAKDSLETLATMVERPYVNHVPVMTGGSGKRQLGRFYSRYFIPMMPPDVAMVPISRTVGRDSIVDEFVFKFTHSVQMEWLLPGVPPTGRSVEVVTLVVAHFEQGKLAREHIHWDQATVLVQIGLLDPTGLPVAGVETARKALDPALPSNLLIKRALQDDEL
jgi:carboxymethylenebutenolidase